MSKIIVEIEWDLDNSHWLNADNVSLALHAYCPNTHFVVREIDESLVGSISKEKLYVHDMDAWFRDVDTWGGEIKSPDTQLEIISLGHVASHPSLCHDCVNPDRPPINLATGLFGCEVICSLYQRWCGKKEEWNE